MNDVVGQALLDYQLGNSTAEIKVHSDLSEDSIIAVPYLFRTVEEMPELEQVALENCKGKVLDAGAGSGCHSIVLQQQGMEVCAIDTSAGAMEVMQKQGISEAIQINFFEFKEKQFDTILLLMNGVGIAGDLDGLDRLLEHAKTLLNVGGQIILDSSDLIYMYTEEDGSVWVDLNGEYYGVVNYQMSYKNTMGEWFKWLFVDKDTLKSYAEKHGFQFELLLDGEHFDYLARLVLVDG
jgi:SAM-dependent methyltransferase